MIQNFCLEKKYAYVLVQDNQRKEAPKRLLRLDRLFRDDRAGGFFSRPVPLLGPGIFDQ